jgi:hypothetical protein
VRRAFPSLFAIAADATLLVLFLARKIEEAMTTTTVMAGSSSADLGREQLGDVFLEN